jgi:hypothetical protein
MRTPPAARVGGQRDLAAQPGQRVAPASSGASPRRARLARPAPLCWQAATSASASERRRQAHRDVRLAERACTIGSTIAACAMPRGAERSAARDGGGCAGGAGQRGDERLAVLAPSRTARRARAPSSRTSPGAPRDLEQRPVGAIQDGGVFERAPRARARPPARAAPPAPPASAFQPPIER